MYEMIAVHSRSSVELNTLINDCIYNLCNPKLKKNHGYIPLQIITIGQNNFLIRIA